MEIDVPGYRDVVQPAVPGRPLAKPQPFSRKQKLILAACSLSNCFMHMGISMIPLILPPEIVAKGIPYQYAGLIFAIFAVSIVIFEPFQASILPYLGTRKSFCLSSFLGGLCYLSFGMLEYANYTESFVTTAMIIRFIEGFYFAVLITSSNVILCLTFPDRATFAFGVLEGFVGIGYVLGPLIGGPMFKYGGFPAPFILTGLCLLLICIFGYFSLEQITGLDLHPRSMERKRLMRDPAFIGCAFLVFTMGMFWGLFEPTLEPYLAIYSKGPIIEGVIFAVFYLSYAAICPVWGYIFRKVHVDLRWVLLGPLVTGVISMFLGPSSYLLGLIPEGLLGLDVICLVLLNATIAYVFVFSYDIMLKRALFCGLEENVATYAMVIAGFFTASYLGMAVGPVIGGYLYAKVNFNVVSTVASLTSYLMTIVVGITMLIKWESIGRWFQIRLHHRFPNSIPYPQEFEPSETSSLISAEDNRNVSLFQSATPSLQTGAVNMRKMSYGSFGEQPIVDTELQ